jgi:CMP-N-acetylneuraminic acid synthetase
MNVLGITLARGGSKGVPRKNIKAIAGKPLLAYTVEEALRCTLITKYYVSSDDDEILKVAEQYGANAIKRPGELAEDSTPHQPALLHALQEAEQIDGIHYDVVADLRATNPFKTSLDVDGAIQKLIRTNADCVAGVSKLDEHHPSRIKMIYNDRLVDVWPEPEGGRRQDLKPNVYIRNGSVYVVKSEILRAGRFFIGADLIVRPWYMPPARGINIDTEIDFKMAEVLLSG